MTAWARLHVHHRRKTDAGTASVPETPDLLITSDPFSLDQLLAQADEADMVCSVSGISFGPAADLPGNAFFNERLHEKIRELLLAPFPSGGLDTFFSDAGSMSGNTGRLTIYRVKGDVVTSFLSESGDRAGPSRIHQGASEKQYTLVGSFKNGMLDSPK